MGISILTGLTVGSLTMSGGMVGAGWTTAAGAALLRVERFVGGAAIGSTSGIEIGSGGCAGGTTNGSQIRCAKLVLILILIECGRCEAAVVCGGCGIGDGGRTKAMGSGGLTTGGSTMCGDSGIGGSSVRTASNSAVVEMVCGCGGVGGLGGDGW